MSSLTRYPEAFPWSTFASTHAASDVMGTLWRPCRGVSTGHVMKRTHIRCYGDGSDFAE